MLNHAVTSYTTIRTADCGLVGGQLSLCTAIVQKWSNGHLLLTLCDPIDKWHPVVLRWISRRTICSFTFTFIVMGINAALNESQD